MNTIMRDLHDTIFEKIMPPHDRKLEVDTHLSKMHAWLEEIVGGKINSFLRRKPAEFIKEPSKEDIEAVLISLYERKTDLLERLLSRPTREIGSAYVVLDGQLELSGELLSVNIAIGKYKDILTTNYKESIMDENNVKNIVAAPIDYVKITAKLEEVTADIRQISTKRQELDEQYTKKVEQANQLKIMLADARALETQARSHANHIEWFNQEFGDE